MESQIMVPRTETTAKAHCHFLVRDTAQKMALAIYEKMCSNSDTFYKRNPSEKAFVAKLWPSLIEEARATLVAMLRGSYPEELKEQIAAAIIQDNSLTRGRPQRVASRQRTRQGPGQ